MNWNEAVQRKSFVSAFCVMVEQDLNNDGFISF